jgi:Ca2+-binding RTX toxin-like protein
MSAMATTSCSATLARHGDGGAGDDTIEGGTGADLLCSAVRTTPPSWGVGPLAGGTTADYLWRLACQRVGL